MELYSVTGRCGRNPTEHLLQFGFDKYSNIFTLIISPVMAGEMIQWLKALLLLQRAVLSSQHPRGNSHCL